MSAIPQIGDPIFVPKGLLDLGRLARRCLSAFEPALLAGVEAFVSQPGADASLRFEEEVLRLLMLTASHVTAGAVAFLEDAREWVAAAVEQAHEHHGTPLRHRGRRSTAVRFLEGAVLNLRTPTSATTTTTVPASLEA